MEDAVGCASPQLGGFKLAIGMIIEPGVAIVGSGALLVTVRIR
jgi:hypothetical protein